jgi:hypothetical protein
LCRWTVPQTCMKPPERCLASSPSAMGERLRRAPPPRATHLRMVGTADATELVATALACSRTSLPTLRGRYIEKFYLAFSWQIIYTSPQPCSRGEPSGGEPERPSKAWRPRRGLRPHRRRAGRRPWSLDHQEQPLLPGPGNNDNKAPVRVPENATWSAERRGVGSLRRRALASKVRARVRSCTLPDADAASGRLSALRRPSSGREMEKKASSEWRVADREERGRCRAGNSKEARRKSGGQ